jgi:hypothetical protein
MSQERADLWRPSAFVRRLSVSNHERRREADVGMLLKEPRSVNERSSQRSFPKDSITFRSSAMRPRYFAASSSAEKREVPRNETSPTDCLR